MKDYLNAIERNQIMVLMSIVDLMDGKRNGGIDGPKISSMLKDWDSRGNLTKDEHKTLKTAHTYINKFIDSILKRLSEKEKNELNKRITKFDFRLVDDFAFQKISRDIQNKMVNAVVPRQQFYKWCEEIMDSHCKNCSKDWKECELHEVLYENFIPESTWNKNNCRYAYEKNNEN